jgi:hypothetical protein
MLSGGVQNLPVEQLPFLYISGMNVSVASNTVIAIAPGQCRDQNDNIDIPVPSVQYINSAVNGANGLDKGTLAASTNYLIWEIADSKNKLQPAGLLSLQSNVGPLIPYGYDSMRLIGAVSTDGSTHFVAADVLNAAYYKGYFLQPAVSVLSGGNATSFTAIDLSTPIPTTTDPFVIALCTVTFIPAAVGDTVQFRPTGSSATSNLPTITGIAAGVAQTQNIALNCGVGSSKPEVDYKVTVSGDAVSVSVYGYYVTLS